MVRSSRPTQNFTEREIAVDNRDHQTEAKNQAEVNPSTEARSQAEARAEEIKDKAGEFASKAGEFAGKAGQRMGSALGGAAGSAAGFFDRLVNDEYGHAANNFIRTMAKVALVLSGVFVALAVIGLLLIAYIEEFALFVIIPALLAALLFVFVAANLMWFYAVGNNVAHLRHLSEQSQNPRQ